jgi:outer membrane assembly lipoprotein YfiO
MMRYLMIAGVLMLYGCESNPNLKNDEFYFNQTEDYLLREAKTNLAKKNHQGTVKILGTFETMYPLSQRIVDVEKILIECYYRQAEYPMLKAATDRFLYEHPQDPNKDYIKMLRFLGNIKEARGYPYDQLPFDYGQRDVTKFKDVYFEGKTFLIEHGQSQYAPTVARFMPYLKDIISRHHYLSAQDLYSRQQYIGAISMYQSLTHDFHDTKYAPLAIKDLKKFEETFSKKKEIILT